MTVGSRDRWNYNKGMKRCQLIISLIRQPAEREIGRSGPYPRQVGSLNDKRAPIAWMPDWLIVVKKKKSLGDDLLSQGAAPQVPSALTVLTTGFGM